MHTTNKKLWAWSKQRRLFMQGKIEGFTLVELVVTITIITILAAAGFVSLWGHFASARDAVRLADMQNIYEQLNLSLGKNGELPMPEEYSTIMLSGAVISYQGLAGKTVLEAIGFEGAARDPKDNTYYTYAINSKKSKAQLLVHFEEFDVTKLSNLPSLIPEAYAASTIDYSTRIPGTMGKKIGIILDSATLAPVYGSGLTVDVATTSTSYTAYFDNTTKETGTGGVLSPTFLNNGVAALAVAGTFSLSASSVSSGSTVTITNNCTSAPTSYTSSNTSVATIAGTTITAVGSGTVNITPVGGVCSDTAAKTLTVTPPAVVGTFSLSSNSVAIGGTATITNTCTVAPTSYTSSNTSVATIAGTTITAVAEGTTNITPVGGSCSDTAAKTLTVTFVCGTNTVKDIENNTYNTASVAGGCWMASNFRSKKKPNNSSLSQVSNSTATDGDYATPGAYNNSTNTTNYGLLYKRDSVLNGGGSGTQGICPTGWHVPTYLELHDYAMAIGTSADSWAGDYDGAYANYQVKLTLWASSIKDASTSNAEKYDSTLSSWADKTGASTDFFSLRCKKN